MIAAIDVQYDSHDGASAGLVLFNDWSDDHPVETHHHRVDNCAPYEPGKFFRRELPVIMETLKLTDQTIDTLVVDCYVDFAESDPALGRYLYEALDQKVTIVGVAKSKFRDTTYAVEITRGESSNPLFITSAGVESEKAAQCIEQMSGDFRIPTLLKLADSIARQNENP